MKTQGEDGHRQAKERGLKTILEGQFEDAIYRVIKRPEKTVPLGSLRFHSL